MNENTILISVLAAVALVSIAGLYVLKEPNMPTGGASSDILFDILEFYETELTPGSITAQVTLGSGTPVLGNTLTISMGPVPSCIPAIGTCNVVFPGGINALTVTNLGDTAKITAYAGASAPWGPGSALTIIAPQSEVVPLLVDPACNKAPVDVPLGDIGTPTTLFSQLESGSISNLYLTASGAPAGASTTVVTTTVLAGVPDPVC